MNIYYILYTILAISSLLDFFIGKKNKSIILWIWVLVFTLFGGLRWETGNDWEQYYGYFRLISFDSIFSFDRGSGNYLEPGFVFLSASVKSLFGEFYVFNIIIEFIIMCSIKYVGEKCTSYPLIFFSFIAVPGGSLSFAVRSGLAIALAGLGYVLLQKGKWKSYIYSIMGAASFHLASLVSLFILLVRKIKLGYVHIIFAYAFAFAFSYILRDYIVILATLSEGNNISDSIINYSNYDSKGVAFSYTAHALNFILLLFLLQVKRKTKKTNDIWFNTLLWSMLLFDLIQIVFGEELYELKRIMGYYIFPRTILICYGLSLIKIHWRKFYVPYALFVVLYLFWQITKTCDGYYFELTCVPYKTIFD